MRFFSKFKNIHYMHYINAVITLLFLLLAVFVFPRGIIRIWESMIDLFWSVCYYFNELLSLPFEPAVTVNDYSSVPLTPFWGLPETWEQFLLAWDYYWELIVEWDNFLSYLIFIAELIRNYARWFLLVVVPMMLLLYVLFDKYLSTPNNDYNEDSKYVTVAKLFGEKVYTPVKKWLHSYYAFNLENSAYYVVWFLIWAYNFNIITIVVEFLAYYMYFVVSFDFSTIYRQLYKLLCDLSVMLAFVPAWCWIIVAIIVFCFIRRAIGFKVLYHHEACNCGFINERPIVSMTTGTMGTNKTTMITDMMLLQEKMFRDKALELMLENDLKFPNFPWCNLENALRYAMSEHIVFNLATARKFVSHLRYCFEAAAADPSLRSCIRRHLKKRYRIPYENLIFDYDYAKYGLEYDDKLKVIDLWSSVESYAQLYFIYCIKCSLIISNYSVRSDSVIDDLGNLPRRDNDFYRRNSRFIYELSRYAHIIDFNAMRLGRKLGGEDPKKDSFEFGVCGITEVGKERKNNLQLQELKIKDSETNQKNDGFNDWMKMIRHSATVDYYPFVKVITDEQRAESWGADARQLLEIIHIKERAETKLAMPFFALEELIYDIVFNKFVGLYTRYRYVRSDNTLPMFLFKKIMAVLQKYYSDTYNLFGYKKMTIQIESGTQDGQFEERYYYLDHKRIYADRFSTDCFSEFFTTKSLRSAIGIDDLEEYSCSKATFDELKMQNSYFVADLTRKQENDK